MVYDIYSGTGTTEKKYNFVIKINQLPQTSAQKWTGKAGISDWEVTGGEDQVPG